MKTICLILLLISILIVFMFSDVKSNQIIETYDDKFKDKSFNNCANLCKTRAGCYGFAYDKNKNICYPSRRVLTPTTSDSLYDSEYRVDHSLCNKIKPILNATDKPAFVDRKSNAIYICSEMRDKQPQLYFSDKNKLIKIDEGQNPDFITQVDLYRVKPYLWPITVLNNNNLDIIDDIREQRTLNEKTITQLKRINENSLNNKINEDVVLQKVNVINKTNINKVYKMYDGFNEGEYLQSEKCFNNIPLRSCLKFCSNNDDCVGIEWNSMNGKTCCPMKTLGMLTNRNSINKYGKYYHKQKNHKLSDNNFYLYVTSPNLIK